jgi:uncharacterized protein (TIGR02147 family)
MILDEKQLLANLLKKQLQILQKKNSKFSLRAFAIKLGLSSSTLSEIMNEKRSVSKAKAQAIIAKLNLSEKERNQIKKAFENSNKLDGLKKTPNKRREVLITESEFYLMADWRYFAFMGLTRTSDFKSDPNWIAQRLGITTKEANEVIKNLLAQKIISKDYNGNIRDNNMTYRTSEEFPEELIRHRQVNGLKKVTELIENKNSLQVGFFSTITTDVKKLNEAALMAEDFLKRLSLFLADSTERTEIFELQVQLFPRTQR